MYFLALAADYDGTLAERGTVDANTLAALERFKGTGRRLVLVTGRELADLESVFPELAIFDRIVAENGAVVFDPATKQEQVIAPAPPPVFIERLVERRVSPLSVGRAIVATWQPHETAVLEIIRDLGLELQIIFNKGAVMVLPAGVNKAAGLGVALRELELSAHNVVGVGDAENDHAFLRLCGCSAAVANALPLVKTSANIVLAGASSAGVTELVERICREDSALIPTTATQSVVLGIDAEGREFRIGPHRGNVLIAGQSGIGKSTLATALTEQMAELDFQFCVFDPEGDYDELEHAVALGDASAPPADDDVLELLTKADTSVVVNTLNFELAERPGFFAKLLPQIVMLRVRTGRPHWLIIDEAHHLVPVHRDSLPLFSPQDLPALLFITVHPEEMSRHALATVETIVAVGPTAAAVIASFCALVQCEAPDDVPAPNDTEVLVWNRVAGGRPALAEAARPRQTHKRHTRKYAVGELDEALSFYFRGPDGALQLRAQNLMIFLQIAAGVDDATWEHHRRERDYSTWFREVIKDPELATEAASIELDARLDADASRRAIADAVTRRYTAPASARAH